MELKKRGQYSNIELWFLLGAFLLAAIAGIDLLNDTGQRLNGKLLEKNFIARDLAMAIEAVYASPGDVTYNYSMEDYKFFVDVTGGKVKVKEKLSETKPTSYRIIGSEKVTIENYVMTRIAKKEEKMCDKPIILQISKKFESDGNAKISLRAKNALICLEADEGCLFDSTVIKCE